MTTIEFAHAAGTSIESLVLACCAVVRCALASRAPHAPTYDAVDLAEAWATGNERPYDSEILGVSFQLDHRDATREAAYWLLIALLSNRRRGSCKRVDALDSCALACAVVIGDSTVVEIVRGAAPVRDTIPCPPSDECVQHGLDAA